MDINWVLTHPPSRCSGLVEDGRRGRFLEQLAKAGRGQFVTADRAIELAERVETLLLARG